MKYSLAIVMLLGMTSAIRIRGDDAEPNPDAAPAEKPANVKAAAAEAAAKENPNPATEASDEKNTGPKTPGEKATADAQDLEAKSADADAKKTAPVPGPRSNQEALLRSIENKGNGREHDAK